MGGSSLCLWTERSPLFLHQPVKLIQCELSGFHRIAVLGEMSVFHTLGKEKESAPFPEEPFDLGDTTATEEKQGVRSKEG